jgi:DNA polymerase-4
MLAARRDHKPPLAVGVTLTHLIEREGSSGDLFSPPEENRALTAVIDRINLRYGSNKAFFASAQEAMDAAPMRISFNRIPDAAREDDSGAAVYANGSRRTMVDSRPGPVETIASGQPDNSSSARR